MGIIDRKLLWLALSGTGAANLSGADALLEGESQGLAFDFTDQSVRIIDTSTPSNSTRSTGIVNQGSLVGPSGKLTYTSPSNKLTLQSDGYYKYQAHNIFTSSELIGAAGSTGWTAQRVTITAGQSDPFGGVTAVSFVEDGTASNTHRTFAGVTQVAGSTVVISCYAKNLAGTRNLYIRNDAGATTKYAFFDLVAGTHIEDPGVTVTMTDVGNGWYYCAARFDNATASANQMFGLAAGTTVGSSTYNGDGTSGVYIARAHMYRYPANTDYIKTTTAAKYALPLEYDTSGNCLGLLVEEARTNLVTYSAQPDNAAWTENLVGTIAAGSVTSPRGIAEACTITSSAGAGVHFFYSTSLTVSASTTYSLSTYVKKSTHRYIWLCYQGNTVENHACAVFDLDGGGSTATETDVGTSSGTIVSTSQESVGNGWYRLTINSSIGLTTAYATIGFAESATGNSFNNNGRVNWAPAGTEEFYVWNTDFTLGSFPTSPILTYGAAATRAADNIGIARLATPLPDMTGASNVVSGAVTWVGRDVSKGANVIALGASGSDQCTIIVFSNNFAGISHATTDAGGQTASTSTSSAPTENTDATVSFRFKNDDYASSYSWGSEAQDTDATADVLGNAATFIRIGSNAAGTANFANRIIKSIVVVPSEWSNATLEAKVGN